MNQTELQRFKQDPAAAPMSIVDADLVRREPYILGQLLWVVGLLFINFLPELMLKNFDESMPGWDKAGGDFIGSTAINFTMATSLTLGAIFLLIAYPIVTRLMAWRPLYELDLKAMPSELGFGMALGTGLQIGIFAIIAILGGYSIDGFNSHPQILLFLAIGYGAAICEEFVFRGLLQRVLGKLIGTFPALLIVSAIFGLMHAGNPHMSTVQAFILGMTAGMMIGAIYMHTRRLWVPIGVHFAWNFVQGGVFNSDVSGLGVHGGILNGKLAGPDWLTGGKVGMENSLVTQIVVVCVAAVFIYLGYKKGNYIGRVPFKSPRIDLFGSHPRTMIWVAKGGWVALKNPNAVLPEQGTLLPDGAIIISDSESGSGTNAALVAGATDETDNISVSAVNAMVGAHADETDNIASNEVNAMANADSPFEYGAATSQELLDALDTHANYGSQADSSTVEGDSSPTDETSDLSGLTSNQEAKQDSPIEYPYDEDFGSDFNEGQYDDDYETGYDFDGQPDPFDEESSSDLNYGIDEFGLAGAASTFSDDNEDTSDSYERSTSGAGTSHSGETYDGSDATYEAEAIEDSGQMFEGETDEDFEMYDDDEDDDDDDDDEIGMIFTPVQPTSSADVSAEGLTLELPDLDRKLLTPPQRTGRNTDDDETLQLADLPKYVAADEAVDSDLVEEAVADTQAADSPDEAVGSAGDGDVTTELASALPNYVADGEVTDSASVDATTELASALPSYVADGEVVGSVADSDVLGSDIADVDATTELASALANYDNADESNEADLSSGTAKASDKILIEEPKQLSEPDDIHSEFYPLKDLADPDQTQVFVFEQENETTDLSSAFAADATTDLSEGVANASQVDDGLVDGEATVRFNADEVADVMVTTDLSESVANASQVDDGLVDGEATVRFSSDEVVEAVANAGLESVSDEEPISTFADHDPTIAFEAIQLETPDSSTDGGEVEDKESKLSWLAKDFDSSAKRDVASDAAGSTTKDRERKPSWLAKDDTARSSRPSTDETANEIARIAERIRENWRQSKDIALGSKTAGAKSSGNESDDTPKTSRYLNVPISTLETSGSTKSQYLNVPISKMEGREEAAASENEKADSLAQSEDDRSDVQTKTESSKGMPEPQPNMWDSRTKDN